MTTALLLKIGADVSQLQGQLNQAKAAMNNFSSQMKQLGGELIGAFSATAVANFAVEVSKLAGEAQGVRIAFNQIADSTVLLEKMKKATHNTVSELDLMKRAVEFKNFNLDIEQLPKLLEFAARRAQQTGKSVDYLVDSIVLGLGRKSPLILDNLGLSSAMINEEVSKTGDFFKAVGNIVDQELSKMPPMLETSATQSERLNASIMDFKVALGDAMNSSGALANSMQSLNDVIHLLTDFLKSDAAKAMSAYSSAIFDVATLGIPKLYKEIKSWFGEQESLNKSVTVTDNSLEGAFGIDRRKQVDNLTSSVKKLNTEVIKSKVTPKAMPLAEDPAPTVSTNTSDYGFLKQYDPKIFEQIQADITESLSTIDQEVADKVPKINLAFIDLSETVRGSLGSMAVGFGEAIGNMIAGVGGIEQIAGAVVGGLGNMAVQLGQTMIQFGIAGLALKKLALKPGLAIAAGIALVALGKALSAKASSIVGGGGGGNRGGGGGTGTGISRSQFNNPAQDIKLTGEVKINNNALVVALANANERNKYTRS